MADVNFLDQRQVSKKATKILCILDGFGLAPYSNNNCIAQAKMPNFRRLLKDYFWTTLNADGSAVGQEDGLVGNSEVGHMNIGGLKLVPQLSYQITQSSYQAFKLNSNLTPDQLFDPTEFLKNKWQTVHRKDLQELSMFEVQKLQDPVAQKLFKIYDLCVQESLFTAGESIQKDPSKITVSNFFAFFLIWWIYENQLTLEIIQKMIKYFEDDLDRKKVFEMFLDLYQEIGANTDIDVVNYIHNLSTFEKQKQYLSEYFPDKINLLKLSENNWQDFFSIFTKNLQQVYTTQDRDIFSNFLDNLYNFYTTPLQKKETIEYFAIYLDKNLPLNKEKTQITEEFFNPEQIIGFASLNLDKNSIQDFWITKGGQELNLEILILQKLIHKLDLNKVIKLTLNSVNPELISWITEKGFVQQEKQVNSYIFNSKDLEFNPSENFFDLNLSYKDQLTKSAKVIHLIGLFSTGTIHSDIRHWIGAVETSLLAGAEQIVLHLISDGRDSDKQSLVKTWQQFTEELDKRINLKKNLDIFSNWQTKIFLGSLGGRFYAMDRDKNWDRTIKGLLVTLDQRVVLEKDTKEFTQEILKLCTDYKIETENLKEYLNLQTEVNFQIGSKFLENLTQQAYQQQIFDEFLIPTAFSKGINQKDTVWLINFRTDRMKQFVQILCKINQDLQLGLTILAMNDYGDGAAIEIKNNFPESFDQKGYFAIFKAQPVKNTLAETISKLNSLNLQTSFKQKNFSLKKLIIEDKPVLILSGPSGSGKGTLVKHLLEKYPLLELSISCTTRKIRQGEKHGREYYFLSEDEFKQKIKNKEFLEYQEVYPGVFYGTLKTEIDRIHRLGKIPIFEIDYKGGLNLKKHYPQAVDIFLLPPSIKVLEERLRARGTESEKEIQVRLRKAQKELRYQEKFSYSLVNNQWQDTIEQIEGIFENLLIPNYNYLDSQSLRPFEDFIYFPDSFSSKILKLENNQLNKKLWFQGVKHAFNCFDPVLAKIQESFENLQPDLLILEKLNKLENLSEISLKYFLKTEVSKLVEKYGELAFALKKALEKGIAVFCPEPKIYQKIHYLKQFYDYKILFSFLVLEYLTQNSQKLQAKENLEIEISNYLLSLKKEVCLQNQNLNFDNFQETIQEVFNLNLRKLEDFKNFKDFLNPIKNQESQTSLLFREIVKKYTHFQYSFILQKIKQKAKFYNRIFIIYEDHYLYALEPALNKFYQDEINKIDPSLNNSQVRQLHIAETEKYNHVTFFLNGGQNIRWPGEDWLVIPSNKIENHAEKPEMKAKEVTDKILESLKKNEYDYIIVNYANPDMVGHTGNIQASIQAMEFLDLQLGRLLEVVEKEKHSMVLIADHGNIEFVGPYQAQGQELTDTEHNPSPVPCIIVDSEFKITKKTPVKNLLFSLEEILDLKSSKILETTDSKEADKENFLRQIFAKINNLEPDPDRFVNLKKSVSIQTLSILDNFFKDLKKKKYNLYCLDSKEFKNSANQFWQLLDLKPQEFLYITKKHNKNLLASHNFFLNDRLDLQENLKILWQELEKLENQEILGRKMLEKLQKLKDQNLCQADLNLLEQIFKQRNQIDLANNIWFSQEDLLRITGKKIAPNGINLNLSQKEKLEQSKQLPLWYAGVLLLGL